MTIRLYSTSWTLASSTAPMRFRVVTRVLPQLTSVTISVCSITGMDTTSRCPSVWSMADGGFPSGEPEQDDGLRSVPDPWPYGLAGERNGAVPRTTAMVEEASGKVAGPNMTIVNGEPADECEWKWQVGLRSSSSGSPWCG